MLGQSATAYSGTFFAVGYPRGKLLDTSRFLDGIGTIALFGFRCLEELGIALLTTVLRLCTMQSILVPTQWKNKRKKIQPKLPVLRLPVQNSREI